LAADAFRKPNLDYWRSIADVSVPRVEDYLGIDKYSAPQWLGDRAVRRFHVMAKPAGSACNLDCTYCFYLSKQSLPGGPGGGHMSDETLERFIRDCIHSVTADEVVFSWQGGEPTLLGLVVGVNYLGRSATTILSGVTGSCRSFAFADLGPGSG
jgi:hypothetical protein